MDTLFAIVKFVFSKKGTKILYRWFDTYYIMSRLKISSIFVAFLENMNFNLCIAPQIYVNKYWNSYIKRDLRAEIREGLESLFLKSWLIFLFIS